MDTVVPSEDIIKTRDGVMVATGVCTGWDTDDSLSSPDDDSSYCSSETQFPPIHENTTVVNGAEAGGGQVDGELIDDVGGKERLNEVAEAEDEESSVDDFDHRSWNDDDESWDEDEPPQLELNHEALMHVATCFLPGGHGKCVHIEGRLRGASHEIRVLTFEDGWTCIGRFTRDDEDLDKVESELATIEYVRKHTKIPVPEIYFTNFNPNHVIGAAFVLMERIPGKHLYWAWDHLSTEHKKGVLEQIADVMIQLASLKFDTIGSLRPDGKMGPYLRPDSTGKGIERLHLACMEEYMLSRMPDPSTCIQEVNELNHGLRRELLDHLKAHKGHASLSSPYRLIHADFDGQNMLFTWDDREQPPKLSGIIDWDYSYSGILYELLEYPIFIQDIHWSPEMHAEKKTLRKHFVRYLANQYPKGSEDRQVVRECFRMKSWLLQNFDYMWVDKDDEPYLEYRWKRLTDVRDGSAKTYEGVSDWEPDSELESDDEEVEGTSCG